MICKYCGQEFEPKRSGQKFCCGACREKSYRARTYTKTCLYCGKEFTTHQKNAKYCSAACASRKHADEIRTVSTCQFCGKPFYPDHPKRNKYCSKECYEKMRDAQAEERREKERVEREERLKRVCPVCGKEFIANTVCRIYCSDECMNEAQLNNKREAWAEQYVPRTVTCRECGKKFTTAVGHNRSAYCSDQCANRALHRRDKEKRRKEMAAAFRETVHIRPVYNRAHGVCEICGLPVPLTVEPSNQWAATRDHKVPLSKGGLHRRDNVQLAHRICNSLKGDSFPGFRIDWEKMASEDPERWTDQLGDLKTQLEKQNDSKGKAV